MPTPAERQAIAFLASVAVLGAGVRALQSHSLDRAVSAAVGAPGSAPLALENQLAAVSEARAKSSRKPASSLPSEPINVDVATAEELDALPRVGPALAERIVADRDSLGPFGSIEQLQRVKGIGPAMARTLSPHVTFSPGFRPLHGESSHRRSP